MIAGHRSVEPGATVALAKLDLAPLLDLGLRLGEGTGAVLAYPIVAGAVRVLHEMATFDSAGVTEKVERVSRASPELSPGRRRESRELRVGADEGRAATVTDLYPLALRLDGRPVLVVGGGRGGHPAGAGAAGGRRPGAPGRRRS